MKEENRQVRRITEDPKTDSGVKKDGYIQNEEQTKAGLWKRIKHKDE
jgi:hypothetical protein